MGVLEQLDDDDRALVVEVLSRYASDLLAALEQGVTLTPGPRERLTDMLAEEHTLEWVKNDGPTQRADTIEALVRKLEKIQPRQPERLASWAPSPDRPLTRGMDRYREIDVPDAESKTDPT